MLFNRAISKISKNKKTATAIAALLLLSMLCALALTPYANALNSPLVTYHYSYVYCSVSANVIGVGQQILLVQWTADLPPDVGETDGIIIAPEHRASWSGQSFNVTDPEGITTNIPIGISDPVGGGYYAYTPTKIGTYTVVSIFPDTWKNSSFITLPDGTQVMGPHEPGYNATNRQIQPRMMTITVQPSAHL